MDKKLAVVTCGTILDMHVQHVVFLFDVIVETSAQASVENGPFDMQNRRLEKQIQN